MNKEDLADVWILFHGITMSVSTIFISVFNEGEIYWTVLCVYVEYVTLKPVRIRNERV